MRATPDRDPRFAGFADLLRSAPAPLAPPLLPHHAPSTGTQHGPGSHGAGAGSGHTAPGGTGLDADRLSGALARPPQPARRGLIIRVSAGSGVGRTPLSAFDAALRDAGVADFNLVRLSSVIPPGATVVDVHGRHQLVGGHGDLLYCVYAAAYAYLPGETAWAGVAWSQHEDGTGAGLFVEHDAHTRADLEWALTSSLEDLSERRGGGYVPTGRVVAPASCSTMPACAVVIASYRREGW